MAASANRSSGAAAGAAQGVAARSSALSPRGPFAAPLERGGGRVPAPDRRREPVFQVLGALGMLTGQRSADHDALDRFGHVQPGAPKRSVERHYSLGAQPVDHLWGLVAG